jgi:isopenicillin-N epimerase
MNRLRLKRPALSKFRRYWLLDPKVVFLNHGSFGACPKAVLKLQNELRGKMEAAPVQFLWRHYEELLEPARAALARFIGARSRDLVFITNATAGVNAVVRSLRLRSGEALLTTNLDYNACHNVLVETARQAGAKVQVARVPFPLRNADQVLEAILETATSRTRLAMIDHVASHSALALPINRIVRELEARGIDTLVDGAHAPGMLPLDVAKLRPAYYTGNLHKWVCAPKGAGFLWVREDKQAGVQPVIISHGHNTPRPGYGTFQDRFDWAGTFDPTAWFCVGAAIDWMDRLVPGGWRELRQRNHQLAVMARRLLCQRLKLEPPCPENMLGAMATLPLPDTFQDVPKTGRIDAEQLRLYDEFGIEVPLVRFGRSERRWFRVSAQIYNSLAEYEYLAEALSSIHSDRETTKVTKNTKKRSS